MTKRKSKSPGKPRAIRSKRRRRRSNPPRSRKSRGAYGNTGKPIWKSLDALLEPFHVKEPGDLRRATNVVVCFHGHTDWGENAKVWPLARPFPKYTCFLYLNGPYEYGPRNSYEWFSYERDYSPGNIDPSVLKAGLERYMSVMNLEAKSPTSGFNETIEHITNLYNELAASRKRVYFVGSSQGGATAFTAGVRILNNAPDPTWFRGVFAHRMAGLYDRLIGLNKLPPNVHIQVTLGTSDTEGVVQSKNPRINDTHGHWLEDDVQQLEDAANIAFGGTSPSVVMFDVMLNRHDRVVPDVLAGYIEAWAAQHSNKQKGWA